jgi:HlyD family secretion protein
MKKKAFIGLILVVAVFIILYFTVFKSKNGKETGYQKEAITRGSIQALVDTTGTLNPVTIVDIGSQVSGKIEEIYVDFNSHVEAGQIIAKIDQELFLTKVNQNEANYQSSVAALEKSKISLALSEKSLDRSKELFEKKLISVEELENAEANYYNARSDLQSAEARLEQSKSQLESSRVDLAYTIIKSPIDGVVISRNINVGQTVAASFQAPVLFQIANDLAKMQVECSVDEADIGKVEEGQKVTFTVDAFPNEKFSGVVQQVRYSPEVISNVVTYTTIVEVKNPELKLRPGMTATVSIVVGEARDKLLVPNSALRFTPDLTQEQMRALFAEMGMGRGRQNNGDQETPSQVQSGQSPQGSVPSAARQFGGGMAAGRMRDMSRIWMEDENGKLKMVFFKPGVTDNIYTEIVSGDLEEGQEVIVGKGESSSSSSNDNPMRMMRFMRLP